MQAKQAKAQTAIEFLSTYSFAFLIIAVILVFLLLFSSLPKTIIPIQCAFYSGFNCEDAVYFNYSTGSQLVIIATDTEPGLVNISNFSAYLGYHQSTSGYCAPSVVTQGQKVYCLANFSATSIIGQLYSATFYVSANYCGGGASSILNSTACIANSAFTFDGQARTTGSVYSPLNLPPIQSVYCVGSTTSSETQVYYSSFNGIKTGSWIAANSYSIQFNNNACSIYRNYIYCVGSPTSPNTQVYYTPLSSNGIGAWSPTTSYPIKFTDAGCSSYQGFIYCVGSNTGTENQVYYAPVTSSGVGNWVMTSNYPIKLTNAGCSASLGFIYCVGSTTGTEKQSYYASISSSGVGNWIQTTSYPIQFSNAGCSIYNNFIYCVGSDTGNKNQSYYASVSNLGIGAWASTTPYPIQLTNSGCVIVQSNIYCVGSPSSPHTQVYYATISSIGIGTWTAASNYPIALQSAYCEASGSGGGLSGGGGPD